MLLIVWFAPTEAGATGCYVPGTRIADVWIPILPREVLFEDGFESGTLDKWSQFSGFEIRSNSTASGRMSAEPSDSDSARLLQLDLEADQRSIRLEVAIKILSPALGQPMTILEIKDIEDTPILSIILHLDGTAAVKTRKNLVLNSNKPIDDSAWHTIQLDYRPTNQHAGKTQLWIDHEETPAINVYHPEPYGRVSNVVFGDSLSDQSGKFAIDNVKLGLHTTEQLNNEPASLAIQTVPPVEGLNMTLDGCETQTDVDGIGRLTVDYLREDYREHLTFNFDPGDKNIRYETGKLYWRRSDFARMAVETDYRINWQFVDPEGIPIQLSEIDSMTIKSSIGAINEFNQDSFASDIWLKGRRVVPGQGELLEKEVYYTVQSVVIDGQNVVNRSQQKFLPSEQQSWEIELLFFPATFQVRDALFGFRQGSAIVLEYPDGSRQRHELDQGETSLLLPRGDYDISVEGWGLNLSRPLAMTRSQEVNLQLLSYLDLLVIASIAALIVIVPILAGRPWLMHRSLRRASTVQTAPRQGWKIRGMTFVVCLLAAALIFSILITHNRQPDRTTSEIVITTPVSEENRNP